MTSSPSSLLASVTAPPYPLEAALAARSSTEACHWLDSRIDHFSQAGTQGKRDSRCRVAAGSSRVAFNSEPLANRRAKWNALRGSSTAAMHSARPCAPAAVGYLLALSPCFDLSASASPASADSAHTCATFTHSLVCHWLLCAVRADRQGRIACRP